MLCEHLPGLDVHKTQLKNESVVECLGQAHENGHSCSSQRPIKGARYCRPWHEIPRSVLGWRTAATARQRRSDVDPFCYA